MGHPNDEIESMDRESLVSTIDSVREYLMERNSSLFSVEEIARLMNVEHGTDYLRFLLKVKKRADIGILGGKSF